MDMVQCPKRQMKYNGVKSKIRFIDAPQELVGNAIAGDSYLWW